MKLFKRIATLLLTSCLMFTSVNLSGIVVSAQDADPTPTADSKVTVINVTDYGADPSGYNDSAIAIQKAIQAVKDLDGKPSILNFPKGEYDIYPDQSQVRELYVSNTTTDDAYKMKTIGILLEEMSNVTVEGNDSLFMFHGKMTTMATIGCENIKFQNFSMDFQTPTVIDLTVEEVGSNYAVVYVPECFNYSIDGKNINFLSDSSPYTGKPYWTAQNQLPYTQIYDLASGETWRGGSPLFNGLAKIEDLGNNRLKFNYSSMSSGFKAGLCYQMRNTLRDTPGSLFWESKDITLKDLNIHYLHGFGMVGQFTENLTYDGLVFKTPENSGRTTAGFADFIQMSGCKGLVDIKNCLFSNPHDDPINIHGTFMQVVEKIAPNKLKVRYMHHETAGFPNFYVGDEVEFMSIGNMAPVEDSIRKVTEVSNPTSGNRKDIIITLDQDLPDEIGVNTHVVENITYTPEVSITNNIFQSTPTRGILVTTRQPVLIENNYFDSMNMSAIYISNDASYPNGWYESGPTKDVTIRNNVFDKCSSPVIFYEPTGTSDINKPVHTKSLIENNLFNVEDSTVLSAKSVGDLQFKNNTILRYNPNVQLKIATSNKMLNVGESTNLTTNKNGTNLGTNLFKFEACNQVTLSGNHYDGGLNKRINLSGGMNAENTGHITADAADGLTFNKDNRTDPVGTILYKSSDEDVLTVSATGEVTGIKDGSALVTAYSILDGRLFESNQVKFFVGENSGAVMPASVTLSSEGDTISSIGQTLQYTAQILPENSENTELDWSVIDPVTGQTSLVADVDANGLVTARLEGTAIVQAKTVNKIVGTSLFTVATPASDSLKENWTITREDASGWSLSEENDSLKILAKMGNLWATNNSVNNIITTSMGSTRDNISAIVKLSGKTSVSYEEAGIILYNNDDNYTTIQRKHGGGTATIRIVNEVSGTPDETNNVMDIPDTDVYFKLDKSGNELTGYYSTVSEDGFDWKKIGEVTNTGLGDSFRIGFLAAVGGGTTANPFIFSDVSINDVDYGFKNSNNAPTISEIDYLLPETGSVTPGNQVGVTYQYTDPDNDEEGNSLVVWLMSDAQDGIYSPISGATGSELTVPANLGGKFIKAAIIPRDNQNKSGQLYYGEPLLVAAAKNAPNMMSPKAHSETITNMEAANEAAPAPLAANASANSDLKNVQISGTSFAEFDNSVKYYVTTSNADLESVNLNLETQHPDTVFKIVVNNKLVEGNYTGSATLENVALIANHNIIEITATAPNKIDKSYYRFIIMRKGYNNKALSSITIDGTDIVGFDKDITEYNVFTDTLKNISLTVQQEQPSSDVHITNGIDRIEGLTQNIELKPGLNQVVIAVSPDTNGAARYYTVNIRAPKNDDNSLMKMNFSSNIAVQGKFAPDTLAYQCTTGSSEGELTLEALDTGARIKAIFNGKEFESADYTMSVPLKFYEGANTLAVIVTSKNGTQRAYAANIQASPVTYANNSNWESANSGWKEVQIDKAIEADTLTLLNDKKEVVTHKKGIGTHAASTIIFNLAGRGYERFQSYVGVDHSRNGLGTVIFKVLADGVEVFNSGVMTSNSSQKLVDISLDGVEKLTLLADPGTDGNSADHSDWADAKFTSSLSQRDDDTVYTIQQSIKGMGTISTTALDNKIPANDSMVITFQPDPGEELLKAKVDSKDIKPNEKNQYVIPNVTANVSIEAVYSNESATCSCTIENLTFDNADIILDKSGSSKSIQLNAAGNLVNSDCQVDGHNENTISYEYEIISDTTSSAVINENNLLSVNEPGKVHVDVRAFVKNTDITAQKSAVFTVTVKDMPPVEYTVTFQADGGTVTPGSMTVESGKPYGTLPTPVRAGYKFLGWFDGTQEILGSHICNGNITLTAKWEQIINVCTCTIKDLTFNNADIVLDKSGSSKSIQLNAAGNLVNSDCQVDGHDKNIISYEYAIISDTTSSAVIDRNNLLSVSKPGKVDVDVKAYVKDTDITAKKSAVFNVTVKDIPTPAVKYTVTFQAAPGTVSPASMTVESGKPYGTLPIPSRAGYKFLGWFNGSAPVQGSQICNGNITLTAKWEQIINKPGKVTGLKAAKSSSNSIELTWKKVSQATSYKVYRLDGKKWTPVKSTSSTKYTDKKRKAGTKYKYRIAAVNKSGTGAYSSTLTAATRPAKPVLKTKLTGTGKVKLTWKKFNADKIVIYRKTGKGTYKKLTTKPGKSTSYTTSSLKEGVTYRFKIIGYMQPTSKIKVNGYYSTERRVTIR